MRQIAELINVSREFDDGRIVALRSVSLRIDEGESIAVMGRSGSGKSTMLNLLCGLDRPSAGEVRFDGRPVDNKASWAHIRARHVGIVFQDFCLIATLTARQNIELAMMARGDAERTRVDELLDLVGLSSRADELPPQLSGGERQRIGIARALVNRPRLILADEPTGSLDRDTGDSVLALLSEMRTRLGAALMLITHEPAVASLCARRIVLADGRIVPEPKAALL